MTGRDGIARVGIAVQAGKPMTAQGNTGARFSRGPRFPSRMSKTGSMTNTHQRGIAIGPILFVVALLAVLASIIAAGSGSFNSDISAVKAKAQATAILEYVNELQIGVDRVMSRCPDTEISLANSVDSGYAENPLAPADKSCHVFDVNGGGILFKEPPQDVDLTGVPEEIRHYFINTQSMILYFGKYSVSDNSGNDLIIMLPGLRRELCLKINDIVGITLHSGDAPAGRTPAALKVWNYWSLPDHGWSVHCGNNNYWNPTCCLNVSHNDSDSRIPLGSYVLFHVLHVR